MEPWVLKLIILFVLFIFTYLFSLLPLKIMNIARQTTDSTRKQRIHRAISFLSCFAAGVFLGTCLLDLFPDVQEKFDDVKKSFSLGQNRYGNYPFGAGTMVAGFFLVLIVEQVILAIKENQMVEQELEESVHASERNVRKATYGSTTSTRVPDDEAEHLLSSGTFRGRSASIASSRSIQGISNRPFMESQESQKEDLQDLSMHQDPSSHSPIRSFIMLAALSLHSVFEGLAVGLEKTTEGVLSIFYALILHKCIIAFSIGLNLVQSQLNFWAIIRSNAIFCLASPIGIAIGIGIDAGTNSSTQSLVSGLLQGLACGTFLYVTFFEVLPHEFNKPHDRVLKLLFVIFGFMFVNGVLFLEMSTAPIH